MASLLSLSSSLTTLEKKISLYAHLKDEGGIRFEHWDFWAACFCCYPHAYSLIRCTCCCSNGVMCFSALCPTPPRVPPAEVGLLHSGLGLRSDHVLTLPSTTGVLLSPKVTFLTENSFLPIARVACFVERQELPFSIITKEDLIRTKHSHRRLSSLPAWVHGPGGRLPPAVCAC